MMLAIIPVSTDGKFLPGYLISTARVTHSHLKYKSQLEKWDLEAKAENAVGDCGVVSCNGLKGVKAHESSR
jgi:hypothetical protein